MGVFSDMVIERQYGEQEFKEEEVFDSTICSSFLKGDIGDVEEVPNSYEVYLEGLENPSSAVLVCVNVQPLFMRNGDRRMVEDLKRLCSLNFAKVYNVIWEPRVGGHWENTFLGRQDKIPEGLIGATHVSEYEAAYGIRVVAEQLRSELSGIKLERNTNGVPPCVLEESRKYHVYVCGCGIGALLTTMIQLWEAEVDFNLISNEICVESAYFSDLMRQLEVQLFGEVRIELLRSKD